MGSQPQRMRRWARSAVAVPCALLIVAASAYAMTGAPADSGQIPSPRLRASLVNRGSRSAIRFVFTDTDPDAAFACALDRGPFSPCTSPRSYRGPWRGGRHTFDVRVFEPSELQLSAVASYSWWIVRPSAPRIVAHPANPTSSTSAAFRLADRQQRGRFAARQQPKRLECKLDHSVWRPCSVLVAYERLRVGEHTFFARMVSASGPASQAIAFRWRVMALAGAPFSIVSGPVPGALTPGGSPLPIPITLINPGDAPILVSTVHVTVVSSPPRCPAASNVVVSQSNVSPSHQVAVAAHGSVALPAQGVVPPTIALRNLPANQDPCQAGAFGLALSGEAGA